MSDIADALELGLTSSISTDSVLTEAMLSKTVAEMKKNRYDDHVKLAQSPLWIVQPPRAYGKSTFRELWSKYYEPFVLREKPRKEDILLANYIGVDMGYEELKTPLVKALDRAKPEVAIIAELAREAGRGEVTERQLNDTRYELNNTKCALEREIDGHTRTLGTLETERNSVRNWSNRAIRAENKLYEIADKKRRATLAAKKAAKKPVAKKKN